MDLLAVLVSTVIVSTAATGLCRRLLVRSAVMDIPNRRSSHVSPVPRGGGIAIIIVFLPITIYLRLTIPLADDLIIPIIVGGLGVGAVGLLDDLRTVSPKWRLAVHGLAATLAVAMIGPLPELTPTYNESVIRFVVMAVTGLAIVWHLNLFNFMDGIDGIAGSQVIFVLVGACVIGWSADAVGVNMLLLGLAAATAGFLVWNWPPAKIFMGDAGSGFLGYALAVIAVYSASRSILSIWSWIILMNAFVVDATVTLIQRIFRKEKVFEAHRSHAYQRCASRLSSHKKVTLGLWVINVIWLFPLAILAEAYREFGPVITAIAAIPLITAVIMTSTASVD